jgi:hypothetical protein
MAEDSGAYGEAARGARDERDAPLGSASRPAPGKQTLASGGAPVAGGSQASEGGGDRRGLRAEAWLADDDLMAAMGLSAAPWGDAEEGEQVAEESPASEGGSGGGSESESESDGEVCTEGASGASGASASSRSSTGEEPAASPGGPVTDYAQTLSSISLASAEAAASAPAPPSPGSTTDVGPPSEGQQQSAGVSGSPAPGTSSAAPARPAYGPPDQASRVYGPPAPVDEGAAPSKEDFQQQGWDLVNQPGIVYDEAGALLRRAPTSTASSVRLPQNAKIHILKHNAAARWYAVVTGEGHLGYVADWLIWRHLPEDNANVYRIKKGDTPLGIARDHYGPHFNRWGQDLRFVVNALVYVNKHNAHNGTGGAGLAKQGSVTESWFRAAAVEDVYVWLPSVDYLNSIYEEVRKQGGGTGSFTFDTFAKVSSKVGALSVLPSYVGGLVHGFLGSLGDTVAGMTELVKSIFTGEIIDDLKKLWSALSRLTIKDVVEALGSWAQSWAPRLTSENHFVRGHAWGYFAGYLCAEIAMFAIGGGALNALKTSKLATKLGQTIARVAPRLTAAVTRVTSAARATSALLSEAKGAVLKRFGAVVTDAISKVRYATLIEAAIAAGIDPAAAHRLARILHTSGIGARKVASWGDDAFTKLASSPRTVAELEATLPLVKSGRIVGLEDWLRFGASKTGDDAARVAAELREARRLAGEYPEHKINIGGDARAPKMNGDSRASLDLSIDDAAGKTTHSVEMTSIDDSVENASHLSSSISHAAEKVKDRIKAGSPVPGKIESIVEIDLPHAVSKGAAGDLQISRTGDVVQVTRTAPPKHIAKGNIFDEFAKNSAKIKDNQLVDAVTVVSRETGAVLGRIERNGTVWRRVR